MSATIPEVISALQRGEMIILTDDENRENEGDLVMAAEKATPDAVAFMAVHGRGLICTPITEARAEQIGLEQMAVPRDQSVPPALP